VNLASKSATPPPVVGASSAIGAAGASAALTSTLYQQLAGLRAAKGDIFAQFRGDRAAIKGQAIDAMASQVNQSLERGIVGSSIDAGGRARVLTDKEAAIQQALQTRAGGLMDLRRARIDAVNQYWTGQYNIQQQQAAEQSQMALQAFLNDLVMRMGDESAPRGGGGGGGGRAGGAGAGAPGGVGTRADNGTTQLIQALIDAGILPESMKGAPVGTLPGTVRSI
jgi:hypothetical protein